MFPKLQCPHNSSVVEYFIGPEFPSTFLGKLELLPNFSSACDGMYDGREKASGHLRQSECNKMGISMI